MYFPIDVMRNVRKSHKFGRISHREWIFPIVEQSPSQGFLDFLKNVRYAQERTAREPSCCVGTRADQGTGTGLDAGEIVPTAGVDADCVAHIDE